MPRIEPVEADNAPEEYKPLIEQSKQITGGEVINFFKQMADSPKSMKSYMDFAGTVQEGALDRPMQESISRGGLGLSWLQVLTLGPLRRGGARGPERRGARAGTAFRGRGR